MPSVWVVYIHPYTGCSNLIKSHICLLQLFFFYLNVNSFFLSVFKMFLLPGLLTYKSWIENEKKPLNPMIDLRTLLL